MWPAGATWSIRNDRNAEPLSPTTKQHPHFFVGKSNRKCVRVRCEFAVRCTEGTEGLVFNHFTHNSFVFPLCSLNAANLFVSPHQAEHSPGKNLLSRVSETFRGYLSLRSSGAESCRVFIDEDRRLRGEKQRRLLSFSFVPVRCDDITFLSAKVLSRGALSY